MRVRWAVIVVLLLVTGASTTLAVLLFGHGVSAHPFPPYIEGDPSYQVTRYAGQWIGGAMLSGAVALLSLTAAVGRLVTAMTPVTSDALLSSG